MSTTGILFVQRASGVPGLIRKCSRLESRAPRVFNLGTHRRFNTDASNRRCGGFGRKSCVERGTASPQQTAMLSHNAGVRGSVGKSL